jgi:radical SAM superfamily enzyme YgiQ (UPF0313 family)
MDKKPNKRILLIEPSGNLPYYILPLSLAYLKSNTPNRHLVKILDCSSDGVAADSQSFKNSIRDFDPDIVGISASMQTYEEAILAAKTIKSISSDIVTVMGGSHPSIFAEQVMQDNTVDYVFRGEAELAFPIFVDKLSSDKDFSSIKGLVYRKNGDIIKNEINLEEDLDKIVIPDYESIRIKEYIENGYSYGGLYGKSAPIWITRGCPYACSFCSASQINGKKIRHHSIRYAVDWIDHLYQNFGIRQFAIVDDNFTFFNEYVKDFCRTIIDLIKERHFKEKIFFATPNGIRIDRVDDEMLGLMREAGWRSITVAPESGSRKTLKRMRKDLDPDTVPGMIERIKAAKMDVRAFFLVGYPGETADDIEQTVRLIRRCKIDGLILGRFLPIPGTPIFNELVRDKEIPPDYMPPSIFRFLMPIGNKLPYKIYTPKGLRSLDSLWIFIRESVFLAFRNPHSIVFYSRYYGIMGLIKKLLFARKKIR